MNSKLVREFALCATISSLTILLIIHSLVYGLRVYLATGHKLSDASSFVRFVAALVLHLVNITQLNAYIYVVLKTTLYCTTCVFLARECLARLGQRLGWWSWDEESVGDSEAAPQLLEKKVPIAASLPSSQYVDSNTIDVQCRWPIFEL
ncbi:hypothetical protein MKEN_00683500 [Mycena kentingensis (nom. inval.)]|nr:hypothetical protein MKEN_00683500 [Mycena kentingensis (nom. inval.)]